ncbi:MAG: AtpZ/AtpI family protein [Gammaproteobacteria bacterium]|nr:AtpZ/AtpI family protein [Gammaproteobacteria bacterium]MYC98081.1 AtpZ/AtpI family protein [Gammaproteobacteria bacterium]MYF61950.1 AtpZ/AtpI family protein [Gammaproteobacteria bacterium]MYI23320.1 AtpZ/AtpI family protein [Gammaproteobacteria bacterium]
MTLALATGLFLWVGWWLDNRLGTVPVFTVLGAFVGAAAGLYSLYYHVVLEPRRQREREEHER